MWISIMALILVCNPPASPQALTGRPLLTANPQSAASDDARTELETGTHLTRDGELREAISHLLAAQAAGADPYATGVNLSICYIGTGSPARAVALLESLRSSGYHTPATATLLVQAYIAVGRSADAFSTLAAAVASAPADDKMFAYAADACTDHHQYALGLRMMDLGLGKLPTSARLHYEKAVFLAELGNTESARPEFDRAAELDPAGYIGCLARVQKDLYDGNLSAANDVLHQAIQAGHRDYRILSLLGTVLLHEGAAPGDPTFAEAESALEESARQRPDFSATQIALGKMYLMQRRYRDAVQHLQIGRALEPENPAVYTSLAAAYRALGDRQKAIQMSEKLGRLVSRESSSPAPVHP